MSDDPKLAAMRAATEFAIRFGNGDDIPNIEETEREMFALADRWLQWYHDPKTGRRTTFTGPEMAERIGNRGPNSPHPAWCRCDDLCVWLDECVPSKVTP